MRFVSKNGNCRIILRLPKNLRCYYQTDSRINFSSYFTQSSKSCVYSYVVTLECRLAINTLSYQHWILHRISTLRYIHNTNVKADQTQNKAEERKITTCALCTVCCTVLVLRFPSRLVSRGVGPYKRWDGKFYLWNLYIKY